MWKIGARAALIAMLAAAAMGQALGAEADMVREAHDRAAIQDLMWRYVRALDTLNVDAYVSLFVEDGRIVSGENAIVGHEALRALVQGIADATARREAAGEPSPPGYHIVSNATIEFTGVDEAQFSAYWMAVYAAAEPGQPPRVDSVGRERNDVVRVDGEWLIETRDTAPED